MEVQGAGSDPVEESGVMGLLGIAVHDLCRNGGVSWPMEDRCWLVVGHGIAAG